MSQRMEQINALGEEDFRRLLGVKRATYQAMLAELAVRQAAKKKPGRPPVLTLSEQLLLSLAFWREYRTHYHLAVEWALRESTVRRTIERVENALIKSGAFALPRPRRAAGAEQQWEVVVLDVAERPIERPKKSSAPATRARRSATRSKPRWPWTRPAA